MLGNYFYHERIRKSVAMFGSLFNNIFVVRKNSDGTVRNTQRVPLSYAPRDKYLERIRQNADLDTDTNIAIRLPRMSFEIISFVYATERQLNKMNNLSRAIATNDDVKRKIQQGVPYTLNFQLNVYARNQDDALQIVEQILPTFAPQYTLSIKPFSDVTDYVEDVPITLTGVTYNDDYEGALDTRRVIQYQLDFEMYCVFYSAINEINIIREVEANTFIIGDSDVKLSTLTVVPNPLGANPDSDFGFTTTITLAGA
jgi:hypothetical protein